MLYVSLLVEYLDEVVVAVIGLHELVCWELYVDLLALLRPDDPGAVHGCLVLVGVVQVLLGYVGGSW